MRAEFVPISFEEVLVAFKEMQKEQNEAISDHWMEHAQQSLWYRGKVSPGELIVPYSEFRKIVFYSRRGLKNKDALEEILKSNNAQAVELIKGPLNNPPPIIVWLRHDGQFQVDDGCRRSLTACYLGWQLIDAFICVPNMPDKLDYWKTKPKYKPDDN